MSFFPDNTATVTLTASQIKTLHTTPFLVVPGRGGCIIEIKSAMVVYHAGSTPFNPGSGDEICFITGTLPNAFVDYPGGFGQAQGFCDQTTDQFVESPAWWNNEGTLGTNSNLPLADVIGSGISLWQYAALSTGWPTGANWSAGNGTMTVYIRYSYIVA